MTQHRIVLVLFCTAIGLATSGCQQVCDSIPTEQSAGVRIVNAVPNAPAVKVYIDGKLFDSVYYDLDRDSSVTSSRPDLAFGYHSIFLADGSPILAGLHRIVALSGLIAQDTISDTTITLTDRRQTLIYMGKHEAGAKFVKGHSDIKFLYLNDNTREPDPTRTLARFVHAVPDLNGIDVYFSQHIKLDASGKSKPDLTIDYGQVSDETGHGNGTGTLATDYLPIPPDDSDGLRITAKGDTSNTILIITTPFTLKDFFATIVVRGESQPIGHDPIVSSLVLEDGSESQGTYNFSTNSFGVRLVNASHDVPLLYLLPKGPYDQGPRTGNLPLQSSIMKIPTDSVGRYLPLTPFYHGNADYFFATDSNDLTGSIIYSFHRNSEQDVRYSFVLIDSATRGNAARYGAMVLTDTISEGTLRLVNTSADQGMEFTVLGKTYNLQQFQAAYAEVPPGHYSFLLNGVRTVQFDMTSQPLTLFFMPASATDAQPYTFAKN